MFARTERLLLRPGWAEDVPALLRTIGDEAIARNLAQVPWPYTPRHAREYLAAKRPADEPSLLVFRRTQGAPQLIGTVGLGRQANSGIELGYWIARPYWGLGYATEAAAALVATARDSLRLKRLGASHFLDNPASGRVLLKLGFRPVSLSRRYSVGRGTEAPARIYTRVLTDNGCGEIDDAACRDELRMLAA